jgi:hypothetical protein
MARIKEKRERLTGEERKAKIIDAALNLFAEKGFSGTKTKEIAEAARTNEPPFKNGRKTCQLELSSNFQKVYEISILL